MQRFRQSDFGLDFVALLQKICGQVSRTVGKLMTFVYQGKSILHCILMEVLLLEQLKRSGHFIESDWPILPFLIRMQFLFRLAFHQVVSPGPANKYGVAPQSLDKLLIVSKLLDVFLKDHVLVTMTTSLIDGKCPPIIMTMMKRIVFACMIPFLEYFILLQTFPNNFFRIVPFIPYHRIQQQIQSYRN